MRHLGPFGCIKTTIFNEIAILPKTAIQAKKRLATRLGHLGEGAREMAGRRRDLMEQELRARREAEAHFMAYVRGRGRRRS